MTWSGIGSNDLSACYPGNLSGWNRSGYDQGAYSSLCFDPVQPETPTRAAA